MLQAALLEMCMDFRLILGDLVNALQIATEFFPGCNISWLDLCFQIKDWFSPVKICLKLSTYRIAGEIIPKKNLCALFK